MYGISRDSVHNYKGMVYRGMCVPILMSLENSDCTISYTQIRLFISMRDAYLIIYRIEISD